MGKRGPKPTPTAVKKARGNPGKRPLSKQEPKPEISAKCPAPPLLLKKQNAIAKRAAEIWRKTAPPVHRVGLLTDVDLDAFASLCLDLALLEKAYEAVSKDGLEHELEGQNGKYMSPNHALKVINDTQARIHKAAASFGLTPSARVGLELDPTKTPAPPDMNQNEHEEWKQARQKHEARRKRLPPPKAAAK